MVTMSESPLVEVEGLRRRFGAVVAVDSMSFTVARGEVVGFLGPNGAGKTTTMRMITGYLPPDAGRARLAGIDVWHHPIAAKRRLGYLPEGAPLYGEMTALALLRHTARLRGLSRRAWRARSAFVIEALGLDPVLPARIETLSKGYKRRVALAQALLADPEVLVLDEPTDGLDPNQKHQVRRLIRELARDRAVLLSTHLLEEVDSVCDRALIVAGGRIVQAGTPDELRARGPRILRLRVAPAQVAPARAALAPLVALDDDGAGRLVLRLRPDAGPDQGQGEAAVTGALAAAGITPLSLTAARPGLDQVFRAATLDAAAGPAP